MNLFLKKGENFKIISWQEKSMFIIKKKEIFYYNEKIPIRLFL